MKSLILVSIAFCIFTAACSGVNRLPTEVLASPEALSSPSPDNIQPCEIEQGAGTNCANPTRTAPVVDSLVVNDWVEKTLSKMTIEEKVGQLILSGVDGTEISAETCEYLHQVAPGGITFRHENAFNPEQMRQFTADLQDCARADGLPPLFTSIAHEGEYVDRFWEGTTTFPAALAIGATGNPDLAYQTAYAQGQELAYSGINLVLGPSADVLINLDNEVISQRTYGGDPKIVGEFVAAAVRGFQDAGVMPVLKHFPGHGGVSGDSHDIQPVDEANLDELWSTYLPPFQEGIAAGAPVMMFDHLVYPALDPDKMPSTRSPEVTQLARKDLGFQGMILSDSMRMLGVKEGVPGTPQASHLALESGVDMLLLDTPFDVLATRTLLLDVIKQGQLDVAIVDDAVRHVLRVKAQQGLMDYTPNEAPAPDWDANRQLADAIGAQAVTLYKNDEGLIPLPDSIQNVLVIGPGEDWDLYPKLDAELSAKGINTTTVHYPAPWDGPVKAEELLASLPQQATGYDLVLVFTWQAHLNRLNNGDTWQVDLVNQLEQNGVPLVVIAIKSPTDILEFPDVGTYLVMFGTTQGQEKALLDALMGRAMPAGVNPLPGLVP